MHDIANDVVYDKQSRARLNARRRRRKETPAHRRENRRATVRGRRSQRQEPLYGAEGSNVHTSSSAVSSTTTAPNPRTTPALSLRERRSRRTSRARATHEQIALWPSPRLADGDPESHVMTVGIVGIPIVRGKQSLAASAPDANERGSRADEFVDKPARVVAVLSSGAGHRAPPRSLASVAAILVRTSVSSVMAREVALIMSRASRAHILTIRRTSG